MRGKWIIVLFAALVCALRVFHQDRLGSVVFFLIALMPVLPWRQHKTANMFAAIAAVIAIISVPFSAAFLVLAYSILAAAFFSTEPIPPTRADIQRIYDAAVKAAAKDKPGEEHQPATQGNIVVLPSGRVYVRHTDGSLRRVKGYNAQCDLRRVGVLLFCLLLPAAMQAQTACIADAKAEVVKPKSDPILERWGHKPSAYQYNVTWRNRCAFRLANVQIAVKFFNATGERIGADNFQAEEVAAKERFNTVLTLPGHVQQNTTKAVRAEILYWKVTR
jgi:hypothetical protein